MIENSLKEFQKLCQGPNDLVQKRQKSLLDKPHTKFGVRVKNYQEVEKLVKNFLNYYTLRVE